MKKVKRGCIYAFIDVCAFLICILLIPVCTLYVVVCGIRSIARRCM
jgi:hypothetical protein